MPKSKPKKSARALRKKSAPKKVARVEDQLASYISRGCDAVSAKIKGPLALLTKPDQPAAQLAHRFLALRLMADFWGDVGKQINEAMRTTGEVLVPAAFEREGIKSFTLDEGYRVGVGVRFVASIKAENRDKALEWLRNNGLEDLIIQTVNASTLSATGKNLLENGRELPEDIFTTAYLTNTSLTKVPSKQ